MVIVTSAMIRIGRYSAHEKWDILCRHWADPVSIVDPRSGKNGRSVLPRWHQAATEGGTLALHAHFRREGQTSPDAQRAAQALAEIVAREGPGAVDRIPREIFAAGALERLGWTWDADEIPGLDELRRDARRFPTEFLRGRKRALCLFCALFYGRADVIHAFDAGIEHATLVDHESDCIDGMRLIYPTHWDYAAADYRGFLQQASAKGARYDVVIADQPAIIGPEVAWDQLPTILGLGDIFIVNYFAEMLAELDVSPDDLKALGRAVESRAGVPVDVLATMMRSRDVHWAVMKKAGGAD